MKYIIRFKSATWQDSYIAKFMNLAVEALQKKYDNHEFEIVRNPKLEKTGGYGHVSSPLNFSVLNPDTNKYIVVSSIDNWRNHLYGHLGWDPKNMVKMFYSGGFSFEDYYRLQPKHQLIPNIKNVYRSFYYGPYDFRYQDEITDLYNNRKPTNQNLVFRGLVFDLRKNIIMHIDDPTIKIIDRRAGGTNLSYLDFIKELANCKAALSLPGMSEICNRDIECFALGIPVLRPLLHTQFPDPLVPGYHYINVYNDCDYNITEGNPGYKYPSDFGKYLTAKWHIVRRNEEYLKFIGDNAREWYVKNCLIENNVNYLINQINLEELNV